MAGRDHKSGPPFFRPQPPRSATVTEKRATAERTGERDAPDREAVRLRLLLAQAEAAMKLFAWLDRPGSERDPRVKAGLALWEDLRESCRLAGDCAGTPLPQKGNRG